MFTLDHSVLLFFHSLAQQNNLIDFIFLFLAEYLPYVLVIVAFLLILIPSLSGINKVNQLVKIKYSLSKIILLFLPAVTAWAFSDLLKSLIKRPRPFIELSEFVKPIFTHGGIDSFPSGHATFFLALAIGVFAINKKIGYFMIIGAVLVGIARIISGIHFPLDILAGFVIGAGFSYVFCLIFKNKYA